jgi:type II secretory pathway component PulL
VYTLDRQEAALKSQFENEYRQIVPGAAEVQDPLRLVASLRARAGGGSGTPQVLLGALERLGIAVAKNKEAYIGSITYRSGVVDMQLTAPSVTVLENIRRSIDESADFRARIQGTDQDGERVSGRIQIQADSE